MNPALIEEKVQERTIDDTAQEMLRHIMREGIETVWDRYEMQQPPCNYCASGALGSRP